MKKLFILFAIFTTVATMAHSVGINADGSTANTSVILDVKSTTQGFFPPRMTTTERNAISNPATELVIFNTTTNGLEVRLTDRWTSTGGVTTVAAIGSSPAPQSLLTLR
jgi:hypothetical protein